MYVEPSKLRRIIRQRDEIQNWLEANGADVTSEQRQLDPDTPEQFYWHYGYQAALTDLINLMAFETERAGRSGTPN